MNNNSTKRVMPSRGVNFDCMLQLIPSGATYKLFQLLLNKYVRAIRAGQEKVNITKNQMAAQAGVDRTGVNTYIDNLMRMGFVDVDENDSITVKLSIIYSVARAFNNLQDENLKEQFISALQLGRYDVLETLGCRWQLNNRWAEIRPKNYYFCNLSEATSDELIEELRKRNFSGELQYIAKITL